jgi:aerobic carbon-monoxide dehydrogenase large subunit
MRSNRLIGAPIERVEDFRFLTGQGEYVGDINRPHQLYARVIRSSVAHGRIISIDCSEALEMAGVRGVITSKDFDSIPKIPLRSELPSLRHCAQPAIAKDIVRYVGEPIALVVADSDERAEDAAEKISVEIEPLDVILDWRSATKEDCSTFLNEQEGNIAVCCTAKRGDAEAAFRAAPYRKTAQLTVHRQAAMPMETRGLVAEWDSGNSHLTMYGGAKTPFFSRTSLAALLGIAETCVDYIECDVGGGFGARGEVHPEDFLVAYAARIYGQPVKWIEDRRENFLGMNHARDIHSELEIALTLDGVLLGLRGKNYVNIGAYARPSCIVAVENSAMFAGASYRIPNVDLVSYGILSNKVPSGVYRGPGRFESTFFFERLLDMAADELSIDRIDIRMKNLLRASEMPVPLPVSGHGKPGSLDSGDYPTVLASCSAAFNWKEKQRLNDQCIDGLYHGTGVAFFQEGGASGPRENARMEIQSNGDVHVFVGSSALGQGLETVMSQLAADTLELPLESVKVFHGSTTIIHEGFGSSASRATVMGGNAVVMAGTALLDVFRDACARKLGVDRNTLRISGGIATAPDGRSLTFKDVADLGLQSRGSFSNDKKTYSYGAAMAHVAVDPGTGKVKVIDYQIVDDVGRIINPLTLHGQTVGAAVQGLGGAFSEELVYDEEGQLLVGTLADYVTPVAADYPNIQVLTQENYPCPNNPLGAKGAGEGGIIGVGGAIGNAVSAALKSFGVEVTELPLSPNRVWALVHEQGNKRPA